MNVDPAALRIQIYPAESLRTPGTPVELSDEVAAVAARMIALMRGAEGIGLAAPQVGLAWRLFVCHVPPEPGQAPDQAARASMPAETTAEPVVCLNPRITAAEGEPTAYAEGCLSLPGITGDVDRPPTVTMTAMGLSGEPFELHASGLLARCVQHEIDHLDGVLIIDRMSERSKSKAAGQIRALERARR